ncbi:MAG: TonB-dependent receptor, partial [Bacteroidota bacterium]
YSLPRYQVDIALRGIYRGRWGLGDSDGNEIVDAEREFALGYFLLNLAVNKQLWPWLKVEAGGNNLLNVTNEFEPSLPGTIWYGGLTFNFQ